MSLNITYSPLPLKELQNIPDSEIDTSDIPELGDRFWANTRVVTPITKKAITLPSRIGDLGAKIPKKKD